MIFKKKSLRAETICLHKPSGIDNLAEKVPKPNGAVPKLGLRKWKAMPLESKIPVIPAPEGAYYFSRKKVGKKLWIGTPDAEFSTSDPYNYEIQLQYDELHDEYLENFHKKPVNIQRMIEAGFVTKNLDAKCSVKDYNMYRKFLRKLHSESVKKVLKHEADMRIEKKNIKLAEENARRDLERLKKRKEAENLRQAEENRKIEKQNKLKDLIVKYEDRLQKLEEQRKEELRRRILKKRLKMEKFKEVRKMAAKLERRKLVKILVSRKENEDKHIKQRKIRLREEDKERKRIIKDRWEKKQQFQIQKMEREQFLKNSMEQEKQKFIRNYNKKTESARKRMQKLLENQKKFVKKKSF